MSTGSPKTPLLNGILNCSIAFFFLSQGFFSIKSLEKTYRDQLTNSKSQLGILRAPVTLPETNI